MRAAPVALGWLKFAVPAAESPADMFRALQLFVRLHARLLLVLVCGWSAPWAPVQAAPLLVDGRARIEAWPAVGVLADPSHRQTVHDLLGRLDEFAVPRGTAGNLGRNADAVWLRVPLHTPGDRAQRRVLELDYPSLNRVEVYLVQLGRVLDRKVLGNELRYSDRPLPSRAHAAALDLPAGDSEILLRVVTTSSMVLPIVLRTPTASPPTNPAPTCCTASSSASACACCCTA